MDDTTPLSSLLPPWTVPSVITPASSSETLNLRPERVRIIEDGSHSSERLSMIELTIPARTPGPPAHWHEMHDETFLVTKAVVRFHLPEEEKGKGEKTVHAGVGDWHGKCGHANKIAAHVQ
ncbi:MAG: hypothetical protein M1828_006577 [Chrysothrix sp. TS-e1954]|nr:MAG: hypothetical protein M1828_006577 [Chrysothrix sp. TS-e1954]